jgi:signal transduction histidine kinase
VVSEDAESERRALLAEGEALRKALKAEQAARRRAELLAEASLVLAESLDHKVVLDRLAHLVAREFADWCIVDLVEDGGIVRVAGVHADPSRQGLLDELARRFPPTWESPHPAVDVLKTGRPVVFPEVAEAELQRLTEGDEHRRLALALGARSGMVVGLSARGRVLGALTVGSGRPGRHYGPADLELLLDLARRAGTAIENAMLHHQCQEAVRLRDEFLSVASHELNTPMAALMLSLEGLGTDDPGLRLDGDAMVHVAKLAERQGLRLTKLIGNLLDVTRLSRGALELHREEVDLPALVRGVVARYQPELERAGCAVTLTIPEPVVGRWDSIRLEQVVLNLLANAAKFGAHRPITIDVTRSDVGARLSVTDQGIGVDPALHARIFERFERGVSSHLYGGLGLGLYICKRIVDSHEGTIRVASQPGRGATFTVELPLGGRDVIG